MCVKRRLGIFNCRSLFWLRKKETNTICNLRGDTEHENESLVIDTRTKSHTRGIRGPNGRTLELNL